MADNNNEVTLNDVYAVNTAYRSSLGQIRADHDLEPDERRRLADEVYDEAVTHQQRLVDEYQRQRSERRDELTARLYHGDGAFADTVNRFALASNDELKRAAGLARRTNQPEMLRALAIVARENDDSSLFHGLLREDDELAEAFAELAQLEDDPAEMARIRQVLVKPLGAAGGPGVEDITPSQGEVAKAREDAIKVAALESPKARRSVKVAPLSSSVRHNPDLPRRRA